MLSQRLFVVNSFYKFSLFSIYKYKLHLYNSIRGVDMNRIKQLREELKISQKELADKLNKTQQMVSLYENGTYELDLDGYLILSKLFNCSIEYIARQIRHTQSRRNKKY